MVIFWPKQRVANKLIIHQNDVVRLKKCFKQEFFYEYHNSDYF
jgi:hypothetical protein